MGFGFTKGAVFDFVFSLLDTHAQRPGASSLLAGSDIPFAFVSEFSFYSSPGYGITVIPCAIPFR